MGTGTETRRWRRGETAATGPAGPPLGPWGPAGAAAAATPGTDAAEREGGRERESERGGMAVSAYRRSLQEGRPL